jgi:prepilin-type N-terminal cleavage/methylation domain-containing protein
MRTRQYISASRTGFTLVEMMVVLAIIAILAALLLAFLPSLASQTAEANGAANLQGWLNIARQKAVRNQNAYGLRVWISDLTNFWATECSYIEQPDDFTSTTATISVSTTKTTNDTVTFGAPVDLTGGLATSDLWPVQPGDYLEVLGSGLMHQITSVDGVNQRVLLNTGTPFAIAGATSWRIVRAPRVVSDEKLSLPADVVIDFGASVLSYGHAPPRTQVPPAPAVATGYYYDILFGPSGALLNSNGSTTFVAVWVRLPDTSPPGTNIGNVFAGSPTVIAVFQQTGLVGAYPPVYGGTPYVNIY